MIIETHGKLFDINKKIISFTRNIIRKIAFKYNSIYPIQYLSNLLSVDDKNLTNTLIII